MGGRGGRGGDVFISVHCDALCILAFCSSFVSISSLSFFLLRSCSLLLFPSSFSFPSLFFFCEQDRA